MSAENDLTGNTPRSSTQLSLQQLIDKYGEYRHSAYQTALIVFVVSAILAAVSRSPQWVISFKDIAGIVPDSTIGLAGGVMPIFGPIVIYVLYLYFYMNVSETLRLRQCILPRLPSQSADAELILLNSPLSLGDDGSCLTRGTSFIWAVITIYEPLLCYLFLLIDFLFFLEFDGKVIKEGYELFYTFSGWEGIWPSGHFGVTSSLPPVYPVWQPILYTLFLLHLCLLATQLMKELSRNAR